MLFKSLFLFYAHIRVRNLKKNKNIFAVLGESGIGKTTIFKSLFNTYVTLWKQEKIFEFECEHYFDDKQIDQNIILNGKINILIGFATQFPFFFNSKTVMENLFSPLKWNSIRWDKEKKQSYINLFKIEDFVEKKMSVLSGGQRQLINIARMLVINPELAIIDESFSNMDEKMSQLYIDIILKNFPNCLFLITSHRNSDIDFIGCNSIKLIRQKYTSGKYYVTQQ